MAKDDHNGRNWAIGAAVAGTVGFLLGILTAPKSGKESREDIKRVTTKVIRETEKKLKAAYTELQSLIAVAGKKIKAGSKVARKDFDQAVDRAKKAQQSVKEILSAIHEGSANDPELSKALKEADAAIAHLKKYVSDTTSKAK